MKRLGRACRGGCDDDATQTEKYPGCPATRKHWTSQERCDVIKVDVGDQLLLIPQTTHSLTPVLFRVFDFGHDINLL